MHIAKLSIKQSATINHGDWQESATDVLYLLIGLLINNGQIADGDYPIFRQDDGVCAMVMAFNHDSLDARFHNSYINDTLNKLKNDDFAVQMLGKGVDGWQVAHPDDVSAFILTTSCHSQQSPIKSMDFDVVPIHYLPKTYHDDEEYHNLICWQRDYQACDGLQMRCAVGEAWALHQMGDVDSALSQQGIELCRILSSKLAKPVYYHLYRYYRADGDEYCPKCGKDWRLDTPLHGRYDFRCDDCCLLSNIGMGEKD